MTIRDRIRAAISDSYYDARNDGLTMEHAADQATAKVMHIVEETTVAYQPTREDIEWARRESRDPARWLGL